MAALCSFGTLAQDVSREWYAQKLHRKCSWLLKVTGTYQSHDKIHAAHANSYTT